MFHCDYFVRNEVSFRVIKCYVNTVPKWNHPKEKSATEIAMDTASSHGYNNGYIVQNIRAALPWIKQTKKKRSTALNIANAILGQIRKEWTKE